MVKILAAAVAAIVLFPPVARGEDLNAVFKRVNDLMAQKSYARALEELGLARQEIERFHLEKVKTFFPATVAGYTGGESKTGGALGIATVDREYTKGTSTLRLGLRGGNAGSGPGSFGSIAQLGRMVAGMQKQPGVESVRIGLQPGIIKLAGAKNTLTLFLESGAVLVVEGLTSASNEELKNFAGALDIISLEKYLSGKL
ncbi:MAG: hypothetical protein RL417_2271 [Pseudomonadota bacterium]|jgi:hypothetical protein